MRVAYCSPVLRLPQLAERTPARGAVQNALIESVNVGSLYARRLCASSRR